MYTRTLVAVLSLVAASAITSAADAAEPCPVPLDTSRRGPAAVKALGDELNDVAEAVPNLTGNQLRELLLTDRTLWIDQCGHPFYADPAPDSEVGAPEPALTPGTDVFALHSRPGSSRTIYLDFDGYVVTGTGWSASYGSFTALGYSIDSDPAFNTTERARIADIWLRVAEDYAPFDVDVTTALPAPDAITRSDAADSTYGTRVAIVKGTNPIYAHCSCGGIAYLAAFDDTSAHAYFQPAFVFTAGTGTTSKNIAEAATHEVGHNLALHHDGDADDVYYPGQGLWSPIMGNSYGMPLPQWSKGEYTGANNTEDDVAIIHNNGAPLLSDDAGDSRAGATPIGPGTVSRVIGSATDTDWFSFTATGVTSLTVTPQSVSPNLDASVSLLNTMATIVTDDPTSAFSTIDVASGLDGKVARVLTAGTYYAKVDGVGSGSTAGTGYSDYGSLGRYDLTLTTNGTAVSLPAATHPPAMVGRSYATSFAPAGGLAPYTFSLSTGTIPAGLALNSGGSLTGVPTTAGTYTFTVRVSDLTTSAATRAFSVTVAPPLTLAANGPAAAMAGRAYSGNLKASGGTAPYTFSLASGALPNGVSLDSTGTLSGTPTQAGTYTLLARVTDSNGFASTRTYALVVEPVLSLNAGIPPVATVGAAYSTTFTASGGQGPYLFGLSPGSSLPPGLTLAPNGVLSGTPTEAGSYNITVQVVDAGFFSATAARTVTVKPALTLSADGLPDGTVGSPYSARFSASGGTEPYRFSIVAGAPPAGLRLTVGGTMSGTPTTRGTSSFTVQVTDANSVVDRRQFSVTIQAPAVTPSPTVTPTENVAAPTILTSKVPRARVGRKYAAKLRASPPGVWRVVSGKLPKGVRLKASGRILGKPKKAGAFRFTALVTVGDQSASRAFRLVVRRR
jgi:hypothetical protein